MRSRFTRALAPIPIGLLFLIFPGPAGADEPSRLHVLTPDQRATLFRHVRGPRPTVAALTMRQADALANQDSFDVAHYALDLDFDEQARVVSGTVTVTATSLVDGLQSAVLDLRDSMTVTSVEAGVVPLSFTHANDLLEIALDRPFDTGQSFEIRVTYGASPDAGSWGVFGWNKYENSGEGEAVWSLSEPDGARHWWPCKDRPDDKAIVLEQWTVRPEWTATGNGLLQGVETLPSGRKRFTWQSSYPLTTYLVSIAASDYVSFSDVYQPLAGDPIPVDYYVYPEDLADAQVSFSSTPAMMRFLAETFGEYPFVDEKYGMSAFAWIGMEHTTNTSIGYTLIDGDHTHDAIVLHELAHQWWGDSVSPETWMDVWLNEGFATYAEALWAEHLGGSSAYQDYMDAVHTSYFTDTLYDPDHLFGGTVYGKGAWVQHMLRRQLGSEAFFESQRAWYASNKDGLVNTAQYQAHVESYYGASLDWFFQPWVYQPGEPVYEYGFSTANPVNGTHRTYLLIEQSSGSGVVYSMPIDLELVTVSGVQPVTVWNDQAVQEYTFDTSDPITDVRFDPENWILKTAAFPVQRPDRDFDGVPDTLDNCVVNSNPDQANLDGDFYGDVCDDDGDQLIDGLDCEPRDPEQGQPGEVWGVTFGGASPPELAWSAAQRADGYDVIRGGLATLGSDLGSCVATGVTDTTFVDADTLAPAAGFAYLVRGVDAGCGGAGSLGWATTGPRVAPCP